MRTRGNPEHGPASVVRAFARSAWALLRLTAARRLSTRLTIYSVALFGVVLGAITIAVYASVARNVERVVSDELTASAVVFDRVWDLRTAQLETSASLLSRDFGFRTAVASRDTATIQTAVANLRRRLGADAGYVIGPDGGLLALDGGGVRGVAAAIDPASFEPTVGVLNLADGPHQAVSAPILAPTPIGQVVFLRKLDAQELREFVRLSPIAFRPQLIVMDAANRWIAGTEGLTAAELRGAARAIHSGGAPRVRHVGPWIEVVRPLPSLGGDRAALVLRYPIAEAMAPYNGVLLLVLVFGGAGLGVVAAGGWLVARQMTRPIAALNQAAARLERGDAASVEVSGRDELAALGATFNSMAAGIVRRETALELAREDAEAANRAKSQFLANMSHEIRTPLNGILGMAQVMEREGDPRQEAQLGVIRRSGEALLGILNSVLDLSKIEAGLLELEAAPFDVARAVSAAVDPFVVLAEQKGVAFGIRLAQLDPRVGDELRLRQVLSNLASNAVKFTDSGRIDLDVTAEGETVIFRLSDTGPGIAPDKVAEIFGKFVQADPSTTRRIGGSGLGLAICRELVNLMGGRIWAETEVGRGSSFFVVLPLAPGALPGPVADSACGPDTDRPLRILSAEDNETNRLILSALLEPLGVDLVLCDDGAQAVEAYAGGDFDIVLMDIQMPVLNGVDATRAIRDLEQRQARPRTPILALSANVMAHQLEEYSRAGIDGHVAKPIQAEVLFDALRRRLTEADADGDAHDTAA